MKQSTKLSLAALALVALFATGCSKADTPAANTVHSGEVTVNMKNLKFMPNNLTVKTGTKVTFLNKDGMLHDVVQIDAKQLGKEQPGFNSGEVMPAKSWTFTFDKPGTYPIICTQANHWTTGMTGVITVVE